MGEGQDGDLRVQFDRRLKLKFLGSQITTDAGLLAYRELDEAFALSEMVQDTLEDSRSSTAPARLALPPQVVSGCAPHRSLSRPECWMPGEKYAHPRTPKLDQGPRRSVLRAIGTQKSWLRGRKCQKNHPIGFLGGHSLL